MTVRKNFIFDDEIAKHLEELAKRENTTQTNIIKNMIEVKYQELQYQERLKAYNSIQMMPAGSLVDKSGEIISQESPISSDLCKN